MLPVVDTTVRFPVPVFMVARVILSLAVALTFPPFVVIEDAESIVITLAFVPGLVRFPPLKLEPAFRLTFKTPEPPLPVALMVPLALNMMSLCALRTNVAVPVKFPDTGASTVMLPVPDPDPVLPWVLTTTLAPPTSAVESVVLFRIESSAELSKGVVPVTFVVVAVLIVML